MARFDARAADRGCAKEALELLDEIEVRRHDGEVKDAIWAARKATGRLVDLLVQEAQS